ncbi:hypothetical protein, partial [Klebsiella pneumoniae]|uniref:hypothetical protein n=1 Tax=Klebsiella pneumoniae TaxID=573 RepID=UPI001AA16C88
MHGIHCIQLVSIAPLCTESTAFNPASWIPLNSIGIHWAKLHEIYCIYSGSISQRCIDSTAWNLDAWNPLHSIGIN